MSDPGLFPELKHDRVGEIDQQIVDLCTGKSGGPFGLRPTDDERAILNALRYRRGADNAITIRELSKKLKLTDREIKQAVRVLRINFHVPIGSSKSGSDGGYYLIVTAEDLAIFVQGPLQQIRAELAVLRAIAGPRHTGELLGQLQLEVNDVHI